MLVRSVLVASFLAVTSGPLAAQHVAHTLYGEDDFDYLGAAMATAGDVDGDGVTDFLVGSVGLGPLAEGGAKVFSGADYSLIRQHVAPLDQDQLGTAVAGLGDIDGDGFDDYALGAPQNKFPPGCCPGFVWVVSGQDGSIKYDLTGPKSGSGFGSALAGYFDADDDGVGDFAVGAPANTGGGPVLGTVHVYSGATGNKLFAVTTDEPGSRFGIDLVAAGDWNGDGHDDFLVAADRWEPVSNTSDFDGRAWIHSGLNGDELLEIPSPITIFDPQFGGSVTGLGDVNGDSRTDFLISAAGSNTVFVISGADGSALQTYGGLSLGGLAFGYHDYVARVADQDGDSKADALVGGSNVVRLYSTGTGNMLLELTGSDFYGAGVGSPGDIVGDGLPELLIAAIEDDTNGTNSGLVDIVRLAPQDVVSYCVAAPNSAGAGALMGAVGSTSLSINDLALTATGAPPGQNGIFYYGSQPAQNPFGNGFGCIGGPPVVRLLPVVTIDPAGAAMRALDFTVPPLSSGPGQVLPGSTWRFQFWYRDTAGGGSGFNLSDGLEATFSN